MQPVHEEGEQSVGLRGAVRRVLNGPGDGADHLQHIRVVGIRDDNP